MIETSLEITELKFNLAFSTITWKSSERSH
jgi:hypothetical protein